MGWEFQTILSGKKYVFFPEVSNSLYLLDGFRLLGLMVGWRGVSWERDVTMVLQSVVEM